VYTLPVTRSGLRIGEVAQRAGVSVDTIRYYEKRKLLPLAARSEGGFRLFAVQAIERVRFIKQAQEMGFSLDEIGALLNGGGVGECRQMRDLLQAKLQEISQRMQALRAFTRTLGRHLRACEDELSRHGASATCPVIVEIGHAAKREAKK
jgi:DNA-binding transcriptional MerR regulator